jgi:hypothetical protein
LVINETYTQRIQRDSSTELKKVPGVDLLDGFTERRFVPTGQFAHDGRDPIGVRRLRAGGRASISVR